MAFNWAQQPALPPSWLGAWVPSLVTRCELQGKLGQPLLRGRPAWTSGIQMPLASLMALSALKGIVLKLPNPAKSAFCLWEIFFPLLHSFRAEFYGARFLWQLTGNSQWRTVDFGTMPAVSSIKPSLLTYRAWWQTHLLLQLVIWGLNSKVKLRWCTGKDVFIWLIIPHSALFLVTLWSKAMHVAKISRQSARHTFCLLSV